MNVRLTNRQTQVLESAMRGETAKQTGERYGIALGTVKATRQAVMWKLRAKSMTEAVAIYLGEGGT